MRTSLRQPYRPLSAPVKGYSALAAGSFGSLLLAFGLSTLAGCNGPTSYPTAITVTGPASATIDPGASASFTAVVTGGPLDSGVSWSLAGCSVTSCGTLSNIHQHERHLHRAGHGHHRLHGHAHRRGCRPDHRHADRQLSVPINPAITTPAGALPGATFGAAYATSLAATGGITPYTWSITQGALPAGLTLSSTTGAITGTPSSRRHRQLHGHTHRLRQPRAHRLLRLHHYDRDPPGSLPGPGSQRNHARHRGDHPALRRRRNR